MTSPTSRKALFSDALELPPERRAAFLEEACGGDGRLRADVEELLAAHERAGRFLGSPTGEPPPEPGEPVVPGARLGPYTLLQQIGEGGMGTVYMAEQRQPIERRVALKLLRPGMASREVVARFEMESQALAMMDHPGIARVLDAGAAEDGRPYFVMELVKGVPITAYCDSRDTPTEQRLRLFVDVCRAVQHAHQKGIIHRDLKPGNVLVAELDGRPATKVIDFGVARAIGRRLTEKTLFTAFGRVVGTVEYMSPEQATLNQLDVDTRSDVYSLGVLLYELVTGETPFDVERLRSSAFDEALRIIREEDPPRPSTRPARRGGVPGPKGFVRELDWIVMRALEKDRERRYASAAELADDVERLLDGLPITAGPPSGLYRLRKYATRHRTLLVGAASFSGLLVASTVVSAWLAARALAAEARAEKALGASQARLAQVERGVELLASVFTDLDPFHEETDGRPLRAVLGERLDEASRGLESDAVGDALAVARLQALLARAHSGLGHPERAIELLLPAHATVLAELGPQDPTTLGVELHLGLAHLRAGALDAARDVLQETYARSRTALGPQHRDTLDAGNGLALALSESGELPPAIALYEELLEAGEVAGVDPELRLTTAYNLAVAYRKAGRMGEGRALLEDLLPRCRTQFGAKHPTTLRVESSLAHALFQAGELSAAAERTARLLETRRAVLGPDHPDTVSTLSDLATIRVASGQPDLAVPLLEDVHARRGADADPDHPLSISAASNLGSAYARVGRLDDARVLLARAAESSSRVLGPEHPQTLRSRNTLAGVLSQAGETAAALAEYEALLAATERTSGPDHPDTARARNNLAHACRVAGDRGRARVLHEQALATWLSIHGPDHPHTAAARNNLAHVLLELGEVPRSVELYREALASWRTAYGPEHPQTLQGTSSLAVALIAAGEAGEAEALLRECLATWRRTRPDDWWTYETMRKLGSVLADRRAFEEAEPLLLGAHEGLVAGSLPPSERGRIDEARRELVRLYESWERPADAARFRELLPD